MKVETYLRMANLPYKIARDADVRRAPKGKLPYIEDGGKVIADSSFIVDYLKATYGDVLDSWLTPADCATALAFQRMLEENTYWTLVYSRWFEPDGWRMTRAAFFDFLPAPLRWIVPGLAKRTVWKEVHGQGMGRHARTEIYAIGRKDLTACADFLGAKAYFLGDKPSSLDAAVYAFLANVMCAPVNNDIERHARTHANLTAYCERMKSRYYS